MRRSITRLVLGAGGFGEAMSLLKDPAVEVWDRIKMGAAATGAAATAMFFDLKADAASAMQSAIESVVAFGNTAANTFQVAYEAIKAIWGLLPAAIGDLAFQVANSLIDGVEAMLNGVVSRINTFIGGINQGLEALGSERRISIIPDLELGQIENRFEGAATVATSAAQSAFDRAFKDNPLTASGSPRRPIQRLPPLTPIVGLHATWPRARVRRSPAGRPCVTLCRAALRVAQTR
ncbi:hypothetical protein [Antarctobacter heliothermus]